MTTRSPPNSHIPVWPWRQAPPPPPAAEAGLVRALRPGPRFGPYIGHSHVYAPQVFPGADAFAYEGLGLVEYSPIGPGVHNRRQLAVLQPAPWFAEWAMLTSGLGGLVTGQFITQPLVNVDGSESEPLGLPPTAWELAGGLP